LNRVFILIVLICAALATATGYAAIVAGEAWLYLLSLVFVAPVWFLRPYFAMESAEEEAVDRKGDQVKVDVIQNGPFETEPYGSEWYRIGSRIALKAYPKPDHAFKSWTSDTDLIEILDPTAISAWAIVKGPGTITANFY
jgi:hypothetical protein